LLGTADVDILDAEPAPVRQAPLPFAPALAEGQATASAETAGDRKLTVEYASIAAITAMRNGLLIPQTPIFSSTIKRILRQTHFTLLVYKDFLYVIFLWTAIHSLKKLSTKNSNDNAIYIFIIFKY
jgi:hypothetical protein